MSVEILVELAWKSVIFAGVTLLVLRLLRHRSSAERSWVANMALGALVLLPLTLFVVPSFRVQPPEPVAAIIPQIAAPALRTPAPQPPAEATARAAVDATGPTMPFELLTWAYAVPVILLVLLLLVAVLRLQFLRSRAEVLVDSNWTTALSAAQRRMRFKHGTALLVSKELKSPISWGVVRPVILLDADAASDTSQAELPKADVG